MKLNYAEYIEKVKACWLGKNIGGTLGAPFEGKRGAFDVDYYTHDLSLGVIPNDDLDLQLVFLLAAEKYGKALRSEHLAEYWLSLIPVDWSEYGQGKNNARLGFLPPITGSFHNSFKNSCGCFIRSELWACLNPGHPELAVKYAYEDGSVDHAEEGVYGEVFCAAIQSAAFVESDTNELIEIGLSYIPETCAVARAVRFAIDCCNRGLDWKEARKEILMQFPDTFGLMRSEDKEGLPQGELGFDAPANIALMVMAWIQGKGDFSKSICIATGCGEDADCTAGTLAATMGIAFGTKCFEEKWLKPIGNEIKTLTVDLTQEKAVIPRDILTLTDKVGKLMPVFLHGYCAFDGITEIECSTVLRQQPEKTGWFTKKTFSEEIENSSTTIKREATSFNLAVKQPCEVQEGEEFSLDIRFENNVPQQQWIDLTVILLEREPKVEKRMVFLNQHTAGGSISDIKVNFTTENMDKGIHDFIVVASANARVSKIALPLKYIVN